MPDHNHPEGHVCEACLQDIYRQRALGGDTHAALVHAMFMAAHGLFAISSSLDDMSVSLDHVAEALGYDDVGEGALMQDIADMADELTRRPNGDGSEPKLRIVTPNGPETVSPDTGEKPDA